MHAEETSWEVLGSPWELPRELLGAPRCPNRTKIESKSKIKIKAKSKSKSKSKQNPGKILGNPREVLGSPMKNTEIL